PDLYDRLLATLQSYRHRVTVIIQPADNRGFFVEVIARKELEDLPNPIRSTVGGAIFRNDNNVDRQFEVIDASFFEAGWNFRSRGTKLNPWVLALPPLQLHERGGADVARAGEEPRLVLDDVALDRAEPFDEAVRGTDVEVIAAIRRRTLLRLGERQVALPAP